MKKIFSLLAAMSTVLCANATDLTFEVDVQDNIVTVTPSVDDEPYFCGTVDEETLEFFAEATGFDPNIPNNLFLIATFANEGCPLYTGPTTLTCHNGNHILVMCAAELDEEKGMYVATGEIDIRPLIINVNSEIPDVEPMTFTVDCDNDGFTVTPSDDTQEYIVLVVSQSELEMMEQYNTTLEGMIGVSAQTGHFLGHTYIGVSQHTIAEFEEEAGEVMPNGLYYIALAGVMPDVNRHIITSPIYQIEWLVERSTTDIHAVEAASRAAKMFKDGKFYFNGRVLLDGTLAR